MKSEIYLIKNLLNNQVAPPMIKNFNVTWNASWAAWSLLFGMKTLKISPKKIIKKGKEVPAAIADNVPKNMKNLSLTSANLKRAK